MKKHFSLVSAFLGLSCVALIGFTSCGENKSQTPVQSCAVSAMTDSCRLPVAYINVDSLLLNYDFAKDLNEELITKMEDARTKLNSKAQAFEKDYANFQKKLQSNGFLSEERARQAAAALEKKKVELDELNAKLQQEMAQEQAQMNIRLNDTVRGYLKEYNADRKFELIFSNSMYDNILIDFPKYDITEEVLKGLNERYAATKK